MSVTKDNLEKEQLENDPVAQKRLEKEKLEKRYKIFRWIQYISFALSIASCFVPLILSCIRVAPNIESAGEKWSLAGVAVVITVIVSLVALKSLVAKYISKLPYSLVVLAVSVIMLISVISLERIIDDAIAILWVAAISSAAAFVLELTSMLFKALAEHAKEEYGRISDV